MTRFPLTRLLLLVAVLVSVRVEAQMELNEQACASAKAADDDLNMAYRALLSSQATPGAVRATRAAQRAWVAFRDADLAAQFYVPPGETTRTWYGSQYTAERCYQTRLFTEARTEALRSRFPCDGGGPCE